MSVPPQPAGAGGAADAGDLRELPGGGRVLFTDRAAGNLSSVSGANAADAGTAREELRAAVGVEAIVRGYQVHGSVVARVTPATWQRGTAADRERGEREHADGQALALHGVAAMVLAADCLPVAVGGKGAVAMLHAGWRGMAAGILERGIAAVRGLGGEGPLMAWVGPGAGGCCYEVGPEVHAALGSSGSGRLELRRIAERRLLAAGVAEVRHLQACTICGRRYFSHRREGDAAGRQAGLAWLA